MSVPDPHVSLVPIDHDDLIETIAKAVLATRAKGLGKKVWARRVAAAAIIICRDWEEK